MYLRGDGELVWDEADDFFQALQTFIVGMAALIWFYSHSGLENFWSLIPESKMASVGASRMMTSRNFPKSGHQQGRCQTADGPRWLRLKVALLFWICSKNRRPVGFHVASSRFIHKRRLFEWFAWNSRSQPLWTNPLKTKSLAYNPIDNFSVTFDWNLVSENRL